MVYDPVEDVWYPSEDEDNYGADPAFLEGRFGVCPLDQLLNTSGRVLGLVRFVIMPSFSGEIVSTLIYDPHGVSIEVRQAERSLWYSLEEGNWIPPQAKTYNKSYADIPTPLNRWDSLRAIAELAPTVRIAIIDGKEYGCADGVGYRHHIRSASLDLYAEWSNPIELASNHSAQVTLVRAYRQVLSSLGVTWPSDD